MSEIHWAFTFIVLEGIAILWLIVRTVWMSKMIREVARGIVRIGEVSAEFAVDSNKTLASIVRFLNIHTHATATGPSGPADTDVIPEKARWEQLREWYNKHTNATPAGPSGPPIVHEDNEVKYGGE